MSATPPSRPTANSACGGRAWGQYRVCGCMPTARLSLATAQGWPCRPAGPAAAVGPAASRHPPLCPVPCACSPALAHLQRPLEKGDVDVDEHQGGAQAGSARQARRVHRARHQRLQLAVRREERRRGAPEEGCTGGRGVGVGAVSRGAARPLRCRLSSGLLPFRPPTQRCHAQPGAVAVHLQHVLALDAPGAVVALINDLRRGILLQRAQLGGAPGAAGARPRRCRHAVREIGSESRRLRVPAAAGDCHLCERLRASAGVRAPIVESARCVQRHLRQPAAPFTAPTRCKTRQRETGLPPRAAARQTGALLTALCV
jgi:hypothetical protein